MEEAKQTDEAKQTKQTIKDRLEKAQAEGDIEGIKSALRDAKASGGDPEQIQQCLDEVDRMVQANRDIDTEKIPETANEGAMASNASGATAPTAPTAEEVAELRARAETYKLRGNDRLKEGTKSAAKEALTCFTNGLDIHCGDFVLNAQLCSNRAHVRMLLRQFVEAVDDCRRAIEFDPKNVKAYWRGAKASMHLDLYKNGLEFCERGLEQAPNDADLMKLRDTCAEKVAIQQKRRAEQSAASQGDFNADEAMAVQDKVNDLTEQLENLRATIANKDANRMKGNLTLSTLDQTPADVRLYTACGRSFIATERSKVLEGLNDTVHSAEEELPKLKKAFEELDKRKQGAEAELKEMIGAFRRQSEGRNAAGAA